MGISGGPYIVRDSSLILDLDASDANSNYRTDGRIWNDLSGNNNSGSIINGVALNNDSYGSFIFNGTNSYMLLPANFFNHDAGTPFTVSLWFKTSTAGIILGQQDTSSPNSASGYNPAIYTDTNGKIRTSCFWGGSTTNQSVSALSVTDNAWHNITVTFVSSSQISYLDGNSFATLAKTQTTYAATYYYLIGAGTWTGWPSVASNPYFSGSVANMLFYNRALSAAEVQANYRQFQSRFDLITSNIITYVTLNQATAIGIFNNDGIEFSNIIVGYPSYALANAFVLVNEQSTI
jgi:hypothetical protein